MFKQRLFFPYIFLITVIFLTSSCRNSLVINKRQHKKGYYISLAGKESKNKKAIPISKESITAEIENIEQLFTEAEDSTSNYIANVEEKNPENEITEKKTQKNYSNYNLYDILNQNTKAYTAEFTLKDLKNLREELKSQEYKRSFDAVLEFIIYLSLWVGLIVLFFFIEPIVAWILLGILVVVLILIIWATIAIGKALRDFSSHCHQTCRPPSGCH